MDNPPPLRCTYPPTRPVYGACVLDDASILPQVVADTRGDSLQPTLVFRRTRAGLLDDIDKELNTYCMRVREWYGWHFPELSRVIEDHAMYARLVKKMGVRTHAKEMDLSDVLPEDLEQEVKELAEVSMGTEISVEDVQNIGMLCDQVISISEYRTQLFDYLRNRMQAIAPNLTVLVGELVGARLIAHAGSLLNLAKAPASTVQILGAEKALFRCAHALPHRERGFQGVPAVNCDC